MLIVILVLLIGVCMFYHLEVKGRRFSWRWDGAELILTLFLSAVIGVAVAVIPSIIFDCKPPELSYELIETKEIYALEDNIAHDGRYFLGSGTANGDAAYFYVVEEDFGLKTKSKDTDYAYVKYTDETPTVEYYETEFKNHFIDYKYDIISGMSGADK